MSDRQSEDRGSKEAVVQDRDFIDLALASDRSVELSPWFRNRVMRRVRAETELPPLRFPWKRFTAGVALAAVAIVASIAGNDMTKAASVDPGLLLAATVLVIFAARLTTGWRVPRTM